MVNAVLNQPTMGSQPNGNSKGSRKLLRRESCYSCEFDEPDVPLKLCLHVLNGSPKLIPFLWIGLFGEETFDDA
jgi:hypothetical protein